MRPRRFLPGSIDQFGNVIDIHGGTVSRGPCFIPGDISPARKGLLGKAGWLITPVTHYPAIPPRQGLFCIHRGDLT